LIKNWIDFASSYHLLKAIVETIQAGGERIGEMSYEPLKSNTSFRVDHHSYLDPEKIPEPLRKFAPNQIFWWRDGIRHRAHSRHETFHGSVLMTFGNIPIVPAPQHGYWTSGAAISASSPIFNYPSRTRQVTWDNVPDTYLHREDGFPAMIGLFGYHGKFSPLTQLPYGDRRKRTITCTHLTGSWLRYGRPFRAYGPCGMIIHSYREFWEDGRRVKHRHASMDPYWKPPEAKDQEDFDAFQQRIRQTDPYQNIYFLDSINRMEFATRFA
jgi:hypothetical protein